LGLTFSVDPHATTSFANSAEPTGCAFITVDERVENAITVASGANASLAEARVRGFEADDSTVAVFQMEVPFQASLHVAQRAGKVAAESTGCRYPESLVAWCYKPLVINKLLTPQGADCSRLFGICRQGRWV
jgi:hypothetical protein